MSKPRECPFVVPHSVWTECEEAAEDIAVQSSTPGELQDDPEIDRLITEGLWADKVAKEYMLPAFLAIAREAHNYKGDVKLTLTIEDYGEDEEDDGV